jgi:hypothetical protein
MGGMQGGGMGVPSEANIAGPAGAMNMAGAMGGAPAAGGGGY